MDARNNVKKVKLTINPVTTPKGRFFPLFVEADSTMGSTGRIQGESMVMIPPRKEKPRKK